MFKGILNIREVIISSFILLFITGIESKAQELSNIGLSIREGLRIETFIPSTGLAIDDFEALPVFSFGLNGIVFESTSTETGILEKRFIQNYPGGLFVTFTSFGGGHPGWAGEVTFENRGFDTLIITNVVPFTENRSAAFITGVGNNSLARANLFRKGVDPVRVILPDNAWELGYSGVEINDSLAVCAIARRKSVTRGVSKRFETILPPGGGAIYRIHGDFYSGGWQNGLIKLFRDRMLYDIPFEFDNSLYEREDLKWIRTSYLAIMLAAWDNEFYDRSTSRYTFPNLISEINNRFGHSDIYGLWPTWPRLGLDQRNQWDLYRDMPGGTVQLRAFARLSRQYGSRFFIAYNPWDISTRSEDHLVGMSHIIRELEADGVVLDTKASSAEQFQKAADSVRQGVIMYPEGMAAPKDMEGSIAGRVHNAIYLSPELNLNKLIRPDFTIFRVADIGEDIIHREVAIALFNGYGTELNMFRPGRRDASFDEDMAFLARTTFILRQNSDAFTNKEWTPLVNSGDNRVIANRWYGLDKEIYTILSRNPKGYEGVLPVTVKPGYHAVSLWHHNEVSIDGKSNGARIMLEGWPDSYTGTRREGSVDVIALLPKLITATRTGDSLKIRAIKAGTIVIWEGLPGYSSKSIEYKSSSDTTLNIRGQIDGYTGSIVIQLLSDGLLLDEVVVPEADDEPWLISTIKKTPPARTRENGMVLIPSGSIKIKLRAADNFIPHPKQGIDQVLRADTFMIDIYPVTNSEYYNFVTSTGYVPRDTANWLAHWTNGIFKNGQENYPVVNVSIEDAEAYASWAGKRLPTEAEWQLAAQGTDNRKWPWGNEFHGTKCNNSFNRPTPVNAFPKGISPYGVADLVGNVWQLTSDRYSNGSNDFVIIRGGSFFTPDGSRWYLQGGPQQLDKTQMLLLVSPGFDRSETVGFRCVKDIR